MVLFTLAAALQDASVPSSLAVAAHLAVIVIAVSVVAFASMGLILMARWNRTVTELRRLARQTFGPVSDRARSISDNVEFITLALRTDVDRLHDSMQALAERLHVASERMEERIEEFNALMEVVQDEAEGIFLDTASTVRGVREGARAMGGSSRRGLRSDRTGARDMGGAGPRATLSDLASGDPEDGNREDPPGGSTPLTQRHADASTGD